MSEKTPAPADKISTGSAIFDEFLEGGYEGDIVTSVFGPAGSGKTTMCLLAALARTKKVIYVDTEGSFSVERLKQLAGDGFAAALKRIFVLHPTTFEAQHEAITRLANTVDDKVGLVIVDTIAMLYRAEMGHSEDYQSVNKMLGSQMAMLIRIARDKGVPVLLTNQVYADFENKDAVHLVGGDVTKYGSKCLIELQLLHGSKRKALLRKHRHLPHKEMIFEIKNEGMTKAVLDTDKKSFRLF